MSEAKVSDPIPHKFHPLVESFGSLPESQALLSEVLLELDERRKMDMSAKTIDPYAKVLFLSAVVEEDLGNYSQAAEHLQDAFLFFGQLHNSEGRIAVALRLGNLYKTHLLEEKSAAAFNLYSWLRNAAKDEKGNIVNEPLYDFAAAQAHEIHKQVKGPNVDRDY